MKKNILLLLLIAPLFVSAQSTGFMAPTATPSPNGGWTDPANAFVSDDVYTTVPHQSGCRCPFIYLSWDNGSSYSSPQLVGPFGTVDNVLTVGSSSDLWGHAWTGTELTNSNFRLKIANPSTLIEQGYGDFNFVIPAGAIITGIEVRVEQHGDASYTTEFIDLIQVNIHYTVSTPICDDPTGLLVSNISTTGADFDWDNVPGITGFEYVLDNTASDPIGTGTTTPMNSFNASSLSSGTDYYFHLRVDCDSANYSNWITVPFTTLCADPTGLGVSNISNTGADFDWDNVIGITGFEYVLDNIAANPLGSGTIIVPNSFSATSLNAGTNYYFHLRVDCDSSNLSNWVTFPFTTTTVSIDEMGYDLLAEVYPNPSKSIVNITVNENYTGGFLTITDITGKMLTNVQTTNTNTVIDLSAYDPQIYYFIYRWGHYHQVIKVVKQ
jgi:hypothetical protein